MNIVAYQLDNNGTCRFIYNPSEGSYAVVSVENYGGMQDFLIGTQSTQLSASINIYEYAKKLAAFFQSFKENYKS